MMSKSHHTYSRQLFRITFNFVSPCRLYDSGILGWTRKRVFLNAFLNVRIKVTFRVLLQSNFAYFFAIWKNILQALHVPISSLSGYHLQDPLVQILGGSLIFCCSFTSCGTMLTGTDKQSLESLSLSTSRGPSSRLSSKVERCIKCRCKLLYSRGWIPAN